MIDASTGWYVVPASVKAVVIAPNGSVLLARNLREEWELPGGWPTRTDGTVAEVIQREVREEAGIDVEVGEFLHAELAEVGGHQVVIVAYRCECANPEQSVPSDEHSALLWATRLQVNTLELISPYRTAIQRAFGEQS